MSEDEPPERHPTRRNQPDSKSSSGGSSFWLGWASSQENQTDSESIGPLPTWVEQAQLAVETADVNPQLVEALLERSDIPATALASVVCQLGGEAGFMSPAAHTRVTSAVHRWFNSLAPELLPAHLIYALADVLTDAFELHEDAEMAYRAVGRDVGLASSATNDLGVLLANTLARHNEAETVFRESIALDPNNPFPLVSLANLLTDHFGKHAEAADAYRQAIATDGATAVAWYGLANVLQDHLERYDDAEAAYRNALEADPSDAMAWHGLGCLLDDHLGRYDEAERAHRQSVELAAGHLQAWNCLGNLLQDRLARFVEANDAYSNGLRAALAQSDAEGAGYLLYNQCRLLRFRLPSHEAQAVALDELRETLEAIDDQDLELVHGVGLALTDQSMRLRRILPELLTRHAAQEDRLWGRLLALTCGRENIASPFPGPHVQLPSQELEEFAQVLGILADRIPVDALPNCIAWLRASVRNFTPLPGARPLDIASMAPYQKHLDGLCGDA